MKRAFKYSSILLILFFAGFFILTSSNTLLNKAVRYGHSKFASDIKINFKEIDLKINMDSLLDRKIALKSPSSCITSYDFEICYKDLVIDLEFNLLNPLAVDLNFFSLNIYKGYFQVSSNDKKPETIVLSDMVNLIKNSLDTLKKYYPKKMGILISNFQIINSKEAQKLTLKINNDYLKGNVNSKDRQLNINLENIDNKIKGELDFIDREMSFNTDLTIFYKENYHAAFKNIKITKLLKNPITFDLNLDLTREKLKLNLKNFNFKYEYDTLVYLKTCDLALGYSGFDKIIINCPKINLNINNKLDLMASAQGNINNKLNLYNSDELFKISLEANNINKKEFDLSLLIKAAFYAENGNLKFSLKDFNWTATTDQFEKVVARLKKTSFAIPAPINTMKGNIKLSSNKLANIKSNQVIIPLLADIKLSDQKKNRMALNFEGSFNYRINETPKLIGNVVIKEAYINIPPIDPLNKVPKLTKSSRITKNINIKNKEVSKTNLFYNLKIMTENNQSIRIFYQYLEPSFNLGLKASIDNENISYVIESHSKTVAKYLKRKVTLVDLKVESKENQEATIDAELNYFASGHKIILDIIGTTSSPELLLSSSPSASRQDIISLLIYNRKSSQISSNQKQSVGGTEAAIEDKALSLFSIWAFASTPIDYVSYDPASKTYSASITLPGNTAFQIGTNWESVNNLSLRKQLSDSWSIETSYNPNDEERSQDVMLQKEINF